MILGGVYGLLAVVLGAFGAHGLRDLVSAASLESWQTAVSYQMFHALALLLTGLWMRFSGSRSLPWAGAFFTLGILAFSGSIYALVLLKATWLGPITPLGGTLLIAGWTCLCVAALRFQSPSNTAAETRRKQE